MNARRRKRFIAGAVCPRCGVLDRILMYEAETVEASAEPALTRECVDCGFSEVLPAEPAAAPLPGRHDKARPIAPEAERARPIRFYPKPPKAGG
ncbi:MAG: YheV family putative zinc ribbon protein [Pseudomonadales bacterium]|nr:YheV family putative zinc ribbon protein [Pseudomonadales bacterium]